MTAWMEKAERAQAKLAQFREHAKSVIPKIRHNTESIAAGGLAGAMRGAFQASGKEYAIPVPGTGVKIAPELVIGGLALGVALSGQTEVSDDLHAIGAGVLAYSAGREAEIFMTKRQKGNLPPGTTQ